MPTAEGSSQSYSFQHKRPGAIAQFFNTLLVHRAIPCLFGFLCRFKPVIRFPGTNTVIVTSFDLVQELCQRHNDFPVPYQAQVDALEWEPTFLLAMKDTPDYWEILKQVKLLWNADDLGFVGQIAKDVSNAKLDQFGGKIDAIQDMMVPVTEAVIERYYGVPIPADIRQAFFDAAQYVAGFLFGPQGMTPETIATAKSAMSVLWQVIDGAIADAHKNPLPGNTVIGRCIKDKVVDDKHLRSYLMGMILGYLPTNTNANGHALDVILSRPHAYEFALKAGKDGDAGAMLRAVHEALRIAYILPGLWRIAPEDRELGIGTKKTYKIKKGRLIYWSGMSAMRDKRRIKDPNAFDPSRSRDVYLIYGYTFHYCVGAAIADVMMQEIFMSLMSRTPKRASKLRYYGNFPWNLDLTYDK